MKLTKIHKEIFKTVLKYNYDWNNNYDIVDLIIILKKQIKYNRHKIEFFIGELIENKYLELRKYYDDIGEIDFQCVVCNEDRYKIKCELKRKNVCKNNTV